MMLGLMMVWISVPVQAQNVIEDEGIETVDEEDVSDSTLVDSLAADTLAQKLPWPESVKVGIDKLLESKMFETSQVGLMVWDLSADSCIYQRNERQLMRPASTMKLLTAITALDKLGGSYQFKTTLKYTGTIENGVLTGDVYCIGGMDPRFNSDDMSAFVNSLKDMGVDTIRGSIYADRSLKDADLLGEGWCWDDDNPVLSPLVFQRKDIFMDKFLAKLREEGIEYSCFGASEKVCPASAFTVCTRFHTMDQILHKMMKESDNLYAESMYYQIAASTGNKWASAKSARNVERQLIRKIGLDPARYKLADGSGLSLYNYQLRDRYDAVLHLVSAADGAEQFYTTANNAQRLEKADEEGLKIARELDKKIVSAWKGHPHLRVINNHEDFNNKLNRVLKEISNVLAIPQPIEEERKYIVKLTGDVPNAIDSDIVQTYLTGEPGSEIRLRRRGFEGGKYVYVHTTKKRISDNEQIETERQINANLYESMLQQADPYRQRIHKHRKSFIWKGQYFELDEFLEPVSDLMILETRGISANESVKFPPFIQVLEDITGNSKYYNYNIALKR